jgi:hypothetical protein
VSGLVARLRQAHVAGTACGAFAVSSVTIGKERKDLKAAGVDFVARIHFSAEYSIYLSKIPHASRSVLSRSTSEGHRLALAILMFRNTKGRLPNRTVVTNKPATAFLI